MGCQGSSKNMTLQDVALEDIANFVNGTGGEPSIDTYAVLGLTGIGIDDIEIINHYISQLGVDEVDTVKKLKEIASYLSLCRHIDFHIKGIVQPVQQSTYLDFNMTNHDNGDFMVMHKDGEFSFAVPLTDGEHYYVTMQTSPNATHDKCLFLDENGVSIGEAISGYIKGKDVNVTIYCNDIQ